MPSLDLVSRVAARTTYAVRPYPATAVPTTFERHMMNRMGCGYSRRTWSQMRAAGGAQQWFAQQLTPASVPETALARQIPRWFPRLADDAPTRWARSKDGSHSAWVYARDLGNYTALRRMYSDHQVLETMVDFWNNHLHVPLQGNDSWVQRWDYDRTIRAHALGRFEDLLLACSLHPSMLLYLDNAKSVRGAPNENQGRELLELHTVGRTSGYTETMVKHSATILSGYTVDEGDWTTYYDPDRHTTGPVQVLGFTDPNRAANGSQLTVRYLKYLANHPATARMVARRLAVRFVSDAPSDALVAHLAKVFTDSGTDISATLHALVATDEFAASAGRKVRTPVDDLVATVRVLGVRASAPSNDESFAHAIAYLHRSTLVYQWPRPDGAPETNADWASASRMLTSFRMHWLLAGGYYPDSGVSYRRPAAWLPRSGLRLDRYVDHVCRLLLGRGSTSRDLKAVCQATGHRPGERITRKHPLAGYKFVRMAIVLLDSPDHMSR
ncbi:MAG TPA: DUF1800 domain-containing protein [Nocardioidaceae bacterium]|nr:DUF1800 domain-containing protein [Nocardioidaceae bacterium]